MAFPSALFVACCSLIATRISWNCFESMGALWEEHWGMGISGRAQWIIIERLQWCRSDHSFGHISQHQRAALGSFNAAKMPGNYHWDTPPLIKYATPPVGSRNHPARSSSWILTVCVLLTWQPASADDAKNLAHSGHRFRTQSESAIATAAPGWVAMQFRKIGHRFMLPSADDWLLDARKQISYRKY